MEVDVPEAEERRAEEKRGQPAEDNRQHKSCRHREAAERDRHTHAVAIGDSAGLYREQQRKHGEQRREHADGAGTRAEVEGIERNHDLAAALRDGVQHREQHDQVDGHVPPLVPLYRMRFPTMGRVY